MDWNKPYHSETGSSDNHGYIFGQSFTPLPPTNVENKKSEGLLSRIKKPFMPTSWKWMRTSGDEKVFTYRPRLGETTKVKVGIPKQFKKWIRGPDGETFQPDTIELSDNDYLTLGKRQTVNMVDADDERKQYVQTTFPQFEFTQDGTLYELDWNAFSQERKIAHGAWDEDWGYSKQGQPTLGIASMYDKKVSLSWDSKLPWWWLLLAAAGLLLLVKLFSGRGQDA